MQKLSAKSRQEFKSGRKAIHFISPPNLAFLTVIFSEFSKPIHAAFLFPFECNVETFPFQPGSSTALIEVGVDFGKLQIEREEEEKFAKCQQDV